MEKALRVGRLAGDKFLCLELMVLKSFCETKHRISPARPQDPGKRIWFGGCWPGIWPQQLLCGRMRVGFNERVCVHTYRDRKSEPQERFLQGARSGKRVGRAHPCRTRDCQELDMPLCIKDNDVALNFWE